MRENRNISFDMKKDIWIYQKVTIKFGRCYLSNEGSYNYRKLQEIMQILEMLMFNMKKLFFTFFNIYYLDPTNCLIFIFYCFSFTFKIHSREIFFFHFQIYRNLKEIL